MSHEHVNFICMVPLFLSLTIVAKAFMLDLIQWSLFEIDLLRINQCLVLYTSTLGQALKYICKFWLHFTDKLHNHSHFKYDLRLCVFLRVLRTALCILLPDANVDRRIIIELNTSDLQFYRQYIYRLCVGYICLKRFTRKQ